MWWTEGSGQQPDRMKLYIRNASYGLAFFLFLTALRTSVHLASKKSSDAGQAAPLDSPYPTNPRYRRAILDFETTKLEEEEEDSSDSADLIISVKTTGKYHSSRVRDILDTWYTTAPENIFFFTDAPDQSITDLTGDHLINTNCSKSHSRQSLCCKMGVELDYYLESGKKWFCHFDDDNYVNVPELMRVLSQYDPRKDWYIGRPSTRGPIEILDRGQISQKIAFWFATGGAGFCLSQSMARKMAPLSSGGKFMALGERIRLPDDVTVGYLVEHLLGKKLTVVDKFHSHLESMRILPLDTLHEQVSLSAGSYNPSDLNVVPVQNYFTQEEDPNRFKSIHCHLFPEARICRERREASEGDAS